MRPRDLFRHTPNVTAVITGSLVLARSPLNAHSLILCSAQPAPPWRRAGAALGSAFDGTGPGFSPVLLIDAEVRRAPFGPGLRPGPRRQALDAGGASPDDARRSGPVGCDLPPGDRRTWPETTGPASSRSAANPWCVRRGVCCVGVRGNGGGNGAAGKRPVPMRFRATGAPRLPRHLRRVPPSPLVATACACPAPGS